MKILLKVGLAACWLAAFGWLGCASTQRSDIRQVDFKNFTFVTGYGKLKVTNGSFTRNDPNNPLVFKVSEIVFGDLMGDAQQQAAIVTWCNTGGSGDWREGFIYALHDGKPQLLTTFAGGDRACGGIHHVSVENHLLKVERFGTTGAMSSPEWIETTTYRLEGRKLITVGTPEKRNYVNRHPDLGNLDDCE